jgi:predicted AAA+ superfamily ATPase
MNYSRHLHSQLEHHLKRGKSILLLGPRQTGKTTLIRQFQTDKFIQLMDSATRQRYERERRDEIFCSKKR